MGLLDIDITKTKRKIFKDTSISHYDKEMLLNISETHFKETSYESNISYYEDKNIVSDFDFVGVFGGKKIEDIALKVMGEYGTKNREEIIGELEVTYKLERDSNEMIFSKMLEQGVITELIGGRYHLTGGVPF